MNGQRRFALFPCPKAIAPDDAAGSVAGRVTVLTGGPYVGEGQGRGGGAVFLVAAALARRCLGSPRAAEAQAGRVAGLGHDGLVQGRQRLCAVHPGAENRALVILSLRLEGAREPSTVRAPRPQPQRTCARGALLAGVASSCFAGDGPAAVGATSRWCCCECGTCWSAPVSLTGTAAAKL